MADQVTETPHTTVIERRGGGGAIGIFIGLVLLAALILGGLYLINRSANDNRQTDAVTQAAKDVGDSAKKAGDAAQKSAQP
jgi:hypothetical protein